MISARLPDNLRRGEIDRTNRGPKLKLEGNLALVLRLLVKAGQQGCQPKDHFGLNMGREVVKLRKLGVAIGTMRINKTQNCGYSLRYVLISKIAVTEVELKEVYHFA